MRYKTTLAVYTFVWQYYQEHGFPPTQQEIANACFIARSGVTRHLDRLTIWGWIKREDGKARSFQPLIAPEEAHVPEMPSQKVAKKTGKKVTLFKNRRAILINK